MNVRDFLYNFVDRSAKICIEKMVSREILFYGKAGDCDDIDILNKIVEMVECVSPGVCLTIVVSLHVSGATYHLPEGLDNVY